MPETFLTLFQHRTSQVALGLETHATLHFVIHTPSQAVFYRFERSLK